MLAMYVAESGWTGNADVSSMRVFHALSAGKMGQPPIVANMLAAALSSPAGELSLRAPPVSWLAGAPSLSGAALLLPAPPVHPETTATTVPRPSHATCALPMARDYGWNARREKVDERRPF
jgi:hypothetical protein